MDEPSVTEHPSIGKAQSFMEPVRDAHPKRLLWEGLARLEFMTGLVKNCPELFTDQQLLSGFVIALQDAHSVFGLAVEKLTEGDDPDLTQIYY